jgi:hypothetical protein
MLTISPLVLRVTAAPGTADSQAASGMHTGDVGHGSAYSPTRPTTGGTAATNPSKSGAAGQAVVPGNNSTASDTPVATRNTQTGGASRGAASARGNKWCCTCYRDRHKKLMGDRTACPGLSGRGGGLNATGPPLVSDGIAQSHRCRLMLKMPSARLGPLASSKRPRYKL